MALTPDDIDGRQFPAAQDGYDRQAVDRFLAEVAASYRYAVHNLLPGVAPSGSSPPAAATASAPTSNEGLARVGHEVGEILRAAEQLAEDVRAEAEADAAAIRAEAERVLTEARQHAEEDRERAKRLLVRAKEQADTIIAEGEEQAQARLHELEEESRRQTQQALARAHHQAEQIGRVEREALERMRTVRAELDIAIAQLSADGTRPLLDLTSDVAMVQITGTDDRDGAPAPEGDAVSAMVRRAIDRAAEHGGAGEELRQERVEVGAEPSCGPTPDETSITRF